MHGATTNSRFRERAGRKTIRISRRGAGIVAMLVAVAAAPTTAAGQTYDDPPESILGLGQGPALSMMAVDRDERRVYVAEEGFLKSVRVLERSCDSCAYRVVDTWPHHSDGAADMLDGDMAVDPETHTVYITDESEARVYRYSRSGTLLQRWSVGSTADIDGPVGVAVDPRAGRVYVLTNTRTEDDIELEYHVFARDGTDLHSTRHVAEGPSTGSFAEGFTGTDIAVDPATGDTYVTWTDLDGQVHVERFGAQRASWLGPHLGVPPGDSNAELALSPFGDVFLFDATLGQPTSFPATVLQYSSAGKLRAEIEPSSAANLFGDAAVESDGDVLVAEDQVTVGPITPTVREVWRHQARFSTTAVTGLFSAPALFTPRQRLTFAMLAPSGATFGCRLVRRGHRTGTEKRLSHWSECPSRKRYSRLREGRYLFIGRAFDSGEPDETPLRVPVTIDRRAPQTRIAGGPRGTTRARTVRFGLRSSEAGYRFRCRLVRDGRRPRRGARSAGWGECDARQRYRGLHPGGYELRAQASDRAGNRDRSAARRAFTVR